MKQTLGQIRGASEIGYKDRRQRIWHACVDCGEERWVALVNGKPQNLRCNHCSKVGERHPNWKGGWYKDKEGYIKRLLSPNDFFYSMAGKDGYVYEHRLVMAKHLGRCLHIWEIVYHKRGVPKDDNRREGLQLVTDDRHKQITILETKIKQLENRVTLLEAENVLLRLRD